MKIELRINPTTRIAYLEMDLEQLAIVVAVLRTFADSLEYDNIAERYDADESVISLSVEQYEVLNEFVNRTRGK